MSYTLNDQIIAIEAELTSLLEIQADDTYMGFSSLSDDEDFIIKVETLETALDELYEEAAASRRFETASIYAS